MACPLAWLPRNPDLTPLNFCLHKNMVYTKKKPISSTPKGTDQRRDSNYDSWHDLADMDIGELSLGCVTCHRRSSHPNLLHRKTKGCDFICFGAKIIKWSQLQPELLQIKTKATFFDNPVYWFWSNITQGCILDIEKLKLVCHRPQNFRTSTQVQWKGEEIGRGKITCHILFCFYPLIALKRLKLL